MLKESIADVEELRQSGEVTGDTYLDPAPGTALGA